MNMTAIILAGGLATRMGEICCEIPKSMLGFAGHPFLQYLVSWLVRIGLNEVLISTGRLSNKIESVFSTNFWKSKGVRIIKEDSPLGTGGAVRFVSEYSSSEDLFLCNGDTVVALNFFRLYDVHKIIGTSFTAILTLSKDVPNQGAISAENGIITEFREGEEPKEPVDGKNFFRGSSTGCYFMNRSSVISAFSSGYSSLERAILPGLAVKRLVGVVNSGYGFFLDYGIPERYAILKNNAWILKRIYGEPITGGCENEKQN